MVTPQSFYHSGKYEFNEGLWKEGQLIPYAPLLSPLLPPSGWGLKIIGSKFLMLNSPFLPKLFLRKN